MLDWTRLPDDTVIQLFSCLNYRDRASLSSTCRTWWTLKLRFRGPESAEAVVKLQAKNLREISGDCCRKMTDALSVLAARHEALESLVIGPDFCERISSDAVKAIAICCPKLRKLRISGLHEVDADAINALAKNCPNLTDIGFIDCRKVDETALDINPTTVSRFFSSSVSLKVLCALNCPSLEEDASFASNRIIKAIANLSVNANVAKAVADEGGISILVNLARSVNRLVAEEAAGDYGTSPLGAIAEAGGVKALVDLIFKWSRSSGGEGVLERAAGALANLAADDKCSTEVASVGGVHALVTLARTSRSKEFRSRSAIVILAARALANLAAHGDSNSNNAVVGQEAGALEALVQLTRSQHDGVRQEAAGALWNLSFDDRNREAIAAAGGVEALVALAHSCLNTSHGLQERAAGALWGLSVSEANSVAIGREGGVAPLIALARSDAEDVHETAAGALWNLAFNPGNALCIVEEGGVPALVHLCSSSVSKMARFMSALALAYMFDGRMDEIALVGTSTESTSKSVNLDGLRRTALKHIEAFVMTFSDPQAFAAAAASSAPAALAQVTESARIQEAGHLRCSGAEIGRFVAMLRNPSPTLKGCAAFALLQFTIPGGRHAVLHVRLLQSAGAPRVLRAAAAAAGAPIEAKIFARIVLRNLEQHQAELCV
ncbi:UNVERIFIED_CONTAM: protein ARABIDILLO 1 [Sesamum radiatum]|uniref:Protein ARABIDILLO 1 n=1 Tax=Sesamum radiatum TaxID=300843 RepID=A0AAW2V9N3_SESRA